MNALLLKKRLAIQTQFESASEISKDKKRIVGILSEQFYVSPATIKRTLKMDLSDAQASKSENPNQIKLF